MKFLKEDGTIEDGTPLTDRQESAIQRFTDYLHEHLCRNSYHGSYSKHPCRDAANDLIPKMDDSAVGSLCNALYVSEPDPTPVSLVETSTTSETTSQPTSENLPVSTASTEDDIPF